MLDRFGVAAALREIATLLEAEGAIRSRSAPTCGAPPRSSACATTSPPWWPKSS